MKKILYVILLILSLCFNQSQAFAQLGDDEYTLENMSIIQDNGEHHNLLLDCTANNGMIKHKYRGNAGYSKNVEIYVQIGWTARYRRQGDYFKYWATGDNKSYHLLRAKDDDNNYSTINANSELEDPARLSAKDTWKECQFKFLDTTRDISPTEVTYAEIKSKIGATTAAYDNPVIVKVYVKKYGFKFIYHANGQQYGDPAVTWSYDKTNTLPVGVSTNPSKEGYTFHGWNTTGESFSNVGTIVTSKELTNTTFKTTLVSSENYAYATQDFYAQWSPTPYTITYNPNGGSCTISSEPYNIETATRNTPTPTRWGYEFKGWKVVSAQKNWTLNDVYGVDIKQLAKGLYGNVTLEAQWEIKKFPVTTTFSAGKGTASTDQSIVYNQNSTAVTIEAAKNYRITSVKVMMSIDGTDYEKVNQTYDPAVNSVKSYTVPALLIEGSTAITVTTERVSADVSLNRNGLTGQESSIVTVTKSGESSPLYTVILNSANPSVVLNEVPLGTYTISESNWAYRYTKGSQTIEIKVTDTEDKTVTFSGARQSSGKFEGETLLKK